MVCLPAFLASRATFESIAPSKQLHPKTVPPTRVPKIVRRTAGARGVEPPSLRRTFGLRHGPCAAAPGPTRGLQRLPGTCVPAPRTKRAPSRRQRCNMGSLWDAHTYTQTHISIYIYTYCNLCNAGLIKLHSVHWHLGSFAGFCH